jgi:acyl carrier protein
MTSDIISVVLEKLRDMRPDKAAELNLENAEFTTLQSLNLDSLDTLQFAMNVEDALGMNIEIVSFPDSLTIEQLAKRLAAMKVV